MGWGGNQATGARSVAVTKANAFSRLSKAAGLIGMGLRAVGAIQAYKAGNRGFANNGAAKQSLDIVMGGISTFGGPWGAAAGAVYFGVDMTIGWDRMVNEVAPQYAKGQCHQFAPIIPMKLFVH